MLINQSDFKVHHSFFTFLGMCETDNEQAKYVVDYFINNNRLENLIGIDNINKCFAHYLNQRLNFHEENSIKDI